MPSHTSDQISIYGRERERAQFRQILDEALAGHGSLVLISGEAGIGKTTLVSELIATARDRGCLVLSGGCYDLTTTPPYGPWSEAIRGYQPRREQPPIPTWFGDPEELGKVGSQAALFEETRQFFAGVAAGAPLVIVLEDLHWTDPASLDALRYLSRTIRDQPILIIVTYRDDEITRRHDLYRILPLLVRESQAQRIHLGALGHDDLQKLVEDRYKLKEEGIERLVEHIAIRSEGNPFFASEILQGLEDERVLQPVEGGWMLGRLERTQVPPLLLQVLDGRLTRLSDESRMALQAAAVIGQELPIKIWQKVTDLDEMRLDVVITEALGSRLLREMSDGKALRFHHALLREALYESLTASRKHTLHRRVGEVLAETANADPDSVAHHFSRARDNRAIDWLTRAGNRAERAYAWSVAAERFEAAVDLMDGIEERIAERGWLLVRLGMTLRWIDPEKGILYHEEARRLSEQIGDRELATLSRFQRGLMMCFSGRVETGLPEMQAAQRDFDALDIGERTRVPGNINPIAGTVLLWTANVGRFHECLEMGERLLPGFEGFEDQLAAQGHPHVSEPMGGLATQLATTCTAMAKSYAMLGRPALAEPLVERAMAVFNLIEHHIMAGGSAIDELNFITLPYHTEKLDRRAYWAGQAVSAHTRAAGALRNELLPRVNLLPLLVIEGAWDEVNELAPLHRQATANVTMHVIGMAALATVAREQGRSEIAWEQVRQALPLGPDTEPGNVQFLSALTLQRLAISLCLDAGDLAQARRWIEMHDRWLAWSGAVLGRSDHALLQARYHLLADAPEIARQHAEQALTLASEPRQPLALIAAERFLGQLDVNEGHVEEATCHLQVALDLADACAAPFERARTLVLLAGLAATRRDTSTAQQLLREVRAICEPLDAQRTLELADQVQAQLRVRNHDYLAGLSEREVEVLELTAEGLTNAEIGEALYISPRTVAQHLRSVYNKLGVNSRAAAVARWADLVHEEIGRHD